MCTEENIRSWDQKKIDDDDDEFGMKLVWIGMNWYELIFNIENNVHTPKPLKFCHLF